METKYGDIAVAAVTNELTLVSATNSVRGIFDNLKVIALGQIMDGLHFARLATQMYCNDYLGQLVLALGLLQLARQCLGAEIVGTRIDIDEIYLGTTIQSAVGRSHKSNWG